MSCHGSPWFFSSTRRPSSSGVKRRHRSESLATSFSAVAGLREKRGMSRGFHGLLEQEPWATQETVGKQHYTPSNCLVESYAPSAYAVLRKGALCTARRASIHAVEVHLSLLCTCCLLCSGASRRVRYANCAITPGTWGEVGLETLSWIFSRVRGSPACSRQQKQRIPANLQWRAAPA
jgi:hypothetical protein